MEIRKHLITTERLSLHAYTELDRESLTKLLMNPEISKTFMIPSYEKAEQYYELADKLICFSQPEDTKHLEYGIFLGEQLIGFLNDCGYDDKKIEIGYVLDPAFQHRGYMTEAVKAMIADLFDMGFKKIVAGYFEGNEASKKVMLGAGMHETNESDEEEYRGEKHKVFYCEI